MENFNPLAKKEIFTTNWFKIFSKQYSFDKNPYITLESNNSVIFLAIFEGKVILVKQFRPTYDLITTELPSGHIDDGESAENAALRELLEETGYKAQTIEYLGYVYPDTGRLSKIVHCYFSDNIVQTNQIPETGINVMLLPVTELKDFLKQNKLMHAQDIACVSYALINDKIKLNQ